MRIKLWLVPLLFLSLITLGAESLEAKERRLTKKQRIMKKMALVHADSGRRARGFRKQKRRFRLNLRRAGAGPFTFRYTGKRKQPVRRSAPAYRSSEEDIGVSFTFSKPGRYRISVYVVELDRNFQFNIRVVGTPEEEPAPEPEPSPKPDPTPSPSNSAPTPPLKNLRLWENDMIEFGQLHCNQSKINALSTWEGSVWYYDGARVYYQIADYTEDTSWYRCADYVNSVYREYVLSGMTPGWRVFPHGLAEHYWRTGTNASREAALRLADHSAFAQTGGSRNAAYSRETAYLIHAYLIYEELGAGRHPLLSTAVQNALAHLRDWETGRAGNIKPFMVGLTFEALIAYYEKTDDSRIPDAIRSAAEWLRERSRLFSQSINGFVYAENERSEATDLNMLIAPAYSWLYRKFGNEKFRRYGDELFASGIESAWLKGGKHFSQNYRWSFEHIEWRE